MTDKAIVIDWGTTSLRATLVGGDGARLDQLETAQGISTLKAGEHEGVLMAALSGWFTAHGPVPVVAMGMITSRNGWVEVPYVSCPAGVADLARGTIRRSLSNGAEIVFLPGLTDQKLEPFPDVMRGEETQIVGHGLGEDATVILPGTHSKWARVEGRRIIRFQTFITGEMFALLINHSFVARGAATPPVDDPLAFRRGLADAAASGAMLSLLFAARTGVLAGRLSAEEIRSYVSGLVIGQEFRQAREAGWFSPGDHAVIVGNDGLNALYAIAADAYQLHATTPERDEAVEGARAILEASRQVYRGN
ncbi:2-dehydro-3-deoxygalactonokinase [Falsirhodobacter deserti]|uniref:2-dehydro-3-deoxygalactonokinase n=1 Tax=Falsirhodobacter deserti TaxID=1365611 RepID=UPI000FE37940|nr:2-dehydro-3-deoxygalactonokinase [Falsirhodobacter deserti]